METRTLSSLGHTPLAAATGTQAPGLRVALSVVVPVYNERECLPALAERLREVLEGIDPNFEVILVNDGSRDGSLEKMREIHAQDPRFVVLSLSRNFGHQLAVTAGLDHSRGDAVVIIDADLQDPPEVIPEMYERFKQGYDVVYGVRIKREKETAFKILTASMFYRLFRWATDIEMPLDAGDFRLISRSVVDSLCRMRERHRMLRAMVTWVGFRRVGVPYERAGRFAGSTKYPLRKMLRFALDGLASFSTLPLRLATWFGAIVSVLSFLVVAYAVVQHFRGVTVAGWTSLTVVLSFLGGVQLMCLGILGEYIGRIYEEVKGRPLYLVSEISERAAER